MLCNGKCAECNPEDYKDCTGENKPKFNSKSFFTEAEMWQKLNPTPYTGKPKFKIH